MRSNFMRSKVTFFRRLKVIVFRRSKFGLLFTAFFMRSKFKNNAQKLLILLLATFDLMIVLSTS
jgi:hypothetical protein